MTDATSLPLDFAPADRGRLSPKVFPQPRFGAAVLAVSVLGGALVLDTRPTAAPAIDEAATASPGPTTAAAQRPKMAPKTEVGLLDPAPSLGFAPGSFASTVPLGSKFQARASAPKVVVADAGIVLPPPPPAPSVAITASEHALPTPVPARPQSVEGPRPSTRRPPALRVASQVASRAPGRKRAQESGTTVVPVTPPDHRNFLEKLFDMAPQLSGPVLAYAAPGDGLFGGARGFRSDPVLPYDRTTAVYDIAAHTVYLPDGTRLEAHSGLRDRMDDPRHVHESNRGATPPNVYDLRPREALFHGVPALRLTPVGGGGTFGRTGFLAHTYMLGPNGDSNGCVSFRNYDAFLQAFQKGQIRRLAVVARLN